MLRSRNAEGVRGRLRSQAVASRTPLSLRPIEGITPHQICYDRRILPDEHAPRLPFVDYLLSIRPETHDDYNGLYRLATVKLVRPNTRAGEYPANEGRMISST
jgi:hypothetical protein